MSCVIVLGATFLLEIPHKELRIKYQVCVALDKV